MSHITDGAEVWRPGPSPQLIGGRCHNCSTVAFPRPDGCAKCTSDRIVDYLLPPTGTIWTLTIQHIEPKAPFVRGTGPFEPFALGYVDLGGEVFVEGRLVADDFSRLSIGASVVTTTVQMGTDDSGVERSTYGFALQGGTP